MPFSAPFPPSDPRDRTSFSYETVLKRWPVIITGVIDVLHQRCHDMSLESNSLEAASNATDAQSKIDIIQEKIGEATKVIEKISKLKYEMARDRPLEKLPEDGEPGIRGYNDELTVLENEKRNTWFTAPWLYAECYLYRLLRSFLNQTTSWKSFDPFYDQNLKTFKHSGQSIFQIATSMHELQALSTHSSVKINSDPEKIEVLFTEMIQMCLWGNATDLSLLTHISEEDIQHLQSVGKDAQAERAKFILKDDQKAVWQHLQTLKDARIDFVLDNSGFELFTDLVFADFLVTHTPHVSSVVFHPKLIPWFVSDVTPPDFKSTFSLLSDPAFFPAEVISPVQKANPDSIQHLDEMITRWKKYLNQGVFKLSVDMNTRLGGDEDSKKAEFWTTPRPYWDMETEAPEIFSDLKESGLVIFKGDLNYRKLSGDLRWPAWTSAEEAFGPLAGSFPLLSLRTNKADVVVGVDKDIAERLDVSGEKWRVDGRYALVTFIPRSK
ncbi:DUF89 domain-containing protein [Crepidotus variabilis]|uniref:Sugar phosphate phosphatase n=1 Tax=Crepidotus variabilis TaxID=179855 RepID=A0A9P6EHA7_9AGAR|nr:DUF89 domain-containing protein [Crepidotus variabilis]